ncbi:MAG: cation:proton antiporter [Gammaproteobacteria bacterium]
MDLTTVATVALGLLLFALVSKRLDGSVLTPPLIFVAFGFAIGDGGFGVAMVNPGRDGIHLLAEITLILVLFADAARIDLKVLRRDHSLPTRMLLIALPLTIVAGSVAAMTLFPNLGVFEATMLAAILAPTDAALGQAVVTSRHVPVRIRQAVNVESGLNDGIALPAVLLFAAMAGAHHGPHGAGGWGAFVAAQLILGPLVGGLVGAGGARIIDTAIERGYIGTAAQGLAVLALIALCFALAEMVGGNGFIAAFVGGIAFGNVVRHDCEFLFEFMESEGQLLTLVTFLVFGAVLLPEGLVHVDGATLLYALLSLSVLRMLPVWLSLLGTGVRLPTALFLGWFGPRGLASILFLLVILEEAGMLHESRLLSVTVVTVALSVLLHGISAAPFARRYGAMVARLGECAETEDVPNTPLREGPLASPLEENERAPTP